MGRGMELLYLQLIRKVKYMGSYFHTGRKQHYKDGKDISFLVCAFCFVQLQVLKMNHNSGFMQKIFLYLALVFGLLSCTEEVVINLESGEQMIGIYGSITNEKKRHAITLSRSTGFYASGAPEMISSATVTVFDGTNTIEFAENPQQPGVYETIEEIAGEAGLTYQLSVSLLDKDGSMKYFSAESTMRPIPGQIDSATILPYTFTGRELENHLKICPYFPTIADRDMIYLVKVAVNDVLITDTLTESSIVQMAELNGVYFNGLEMKLIFDEKDFPTGIYILDTTKEDEDIQPLDKVTIYLYSIENDYRRFIQDVRFSAGSNPFMGTPANVRSNIEPAGKALGYFYTASMIEYSFVYE